MNRLRVRVELNRRGAGVPLDELVSVVEETRKFFDLLASDVEIEPGRGEWLASDFDTESLNFTAEYKGPASANQIREFGAAFSGSTSLRRETIAQFTHIADLIGEDELVGFGLYQSDQETEPSDWRCLSRRDALRFSEEIQLLAKSAGESVSPLPAVMNGAAGGRRLFKDRRERDTLANDPSKWIRAVESNLSRKIARLEKEVESQTQTIRSLNAATPEATGEKILQLTTALESLWNQAPRQLPPPAKMELPVRMPVKYRWIFGFLLAAAMVALAGVASSAGMARLLHSSMFREAARQETPAARVSTDVAPTDVASSAAQPEPPVELPARPIALSAKSGSAQPVVGTKAIREIALEIPPDLRSMIESEAAVYVTVAIDEEGKVAGARATSTEGEGANFLVPEALKAARQFRFRPAREGKKAVPSQTVLTFVFDPGATTVIDR
jgi:outer membrane biosynthesis protein TonB